MNSTDDPFESLKRDFAHIIDYIVIAKVLDDEGDVEMAAYHTSTLSQWEALGLIEGTRLVYQSRFLDGSETENGIEE